MAPTVAAVTVIVLGLAVAVHSYLDFAYWTRGPGPGFIPLWLGVLLAGLGIAWLVGIRRGDTPPALGTAPDQSATEQAASVEAAPDQGVPEAAPVAASEQDGPSAEGRRRVLAVVGGLAAVVLALDVFGYQLTMFVFCTLIVRFVSGRRWWVAAVFGALAGFGVYVLFAGFLSVQLPTASIELLNSLGL